VLALFVIGSRSFRLLQLKKRQDELVDKYRKEHEMSDNEIEIFKSVMAESKQLILDIEANFLIHEDLRKNRLFKDALQSSKAIFLLLMASPKELTDFGDFLYKSLPLMDKSVQHYVSIEESGIYTVRVKEEKKAIFEVLKKICTNIVKDYEDYTTRKSDEAELSKVILEKESGF
jgi:5-bromo-4-chloroindolyl phosphate hydrolysis protein